MLQNLRPDQYLVMDKCNPEINVEAPPPMQFQYKFNSPFATVVGAIMQKNSWEPRTSLTTVSSVEQVDDDRIVMYRRHENYNTSHN